MKIVYVGQLWEGGTCRMRLRALRALGHTAHGVDTTATSSAQGLRGGLQTIASKLSYLLDLTRVGQRLLEACREVKPDLVWIDKGQLVGPRTLLQLKEVSPEAVLVHYNPDDPFGAYGKAGWRTFLRALPCYDIHFVTRQENIGEYRALGARTVIRAQRGFCPDTHKPLNLVGSEREELGGRIGFIGSYEEKRSEALRRLAHAGLAVRVWGDGWERMRDVPAKLGIEGRSLLGDVYVRGINSFDINLCFLRCANRDKQNSRMFEIPACGAFMLAERTDEDVELFEEGREAEFFDSPEELIDKARFYLEHEDLRRAFAEAGRGRCLRSGYDYRSRMRWMVEQVMSEHRPEFCLFGTLSNESGQTRRDVSLDKDGPPSSRKMWDGTESLEECKESQRVRSERDGTQHMARGDLDAVRPVGERGTE
jgi:hypothetical protein